MKFINFRENPEIGSVFCWPHHTNQPQKKAPTSRAKLAHELTKSKLARTLPLNNENKIELYGKDADMNELPDSIVKEVEDALA